MARPPQWPAFRHSHASRSTRRNRLYLPASISHVSLFQNPNDVAPYEFTEPSAFGLSCKFRYGPPITEDLPLNFRDYSTTTTITTILLRKCRYVPSSTPF